jgi:tRNA(Arg) A34 adenosine deaminase TadA
MMAENKDAMWMEYAYQLAVKAQSFHEVPVGAVLVYRSERPC